MPLDNINDVFAKLAGMVSEPEDDADEKDLIAFAAATAGLALARIIVTDLRRIADAQEAIATEYARVQAGTL
jgi:hypothetical protein